VLCARSFIIIFSVGGPFTVGVAKRSGKMPYGVSV